MLVLVLIVFLFEEMSSGYLLGLEVKLFLDTFGCTPS